MSREIDETQEIDKMQEEIDNLKKIVDKLVEYSEKRAEALVYVRGKINSLKEEK